jgi:hypothetical protein
MQVKFDVSREALKWIAVATMTVDHVGAIFYPNYVVLRIIGRISFPLFSYLAALGFETTRNIKKYFIRLLLFGLVSQVPFYLATGSGIFEHLNIFFTLSFGILFILFLEKKSLWFVLPILVSFLNFDYGVYGILLIGSMHILRKDKETGIAAIVLLNLLFLFQWSLQIFSLLALPIILLYNSGFLMKVNESRGIKAYPVWRKYFFYVYYPLHLALFYLIKLYYFH